MESEAEMLEDAGQLCVYVCSRTKSAWAEQLADSLAGG